MKYLLFIMAATFSFSSVAARHKIFKQHSNIIRKADTILIYTIDSIPTDPKLHDSAKKYVGDYAIATTKNFDTAKITSLKKAVLKQANYLSDVMKRCPFIAKYAIEFVKGKKKIIIIVSPATCSKVMVYLPNRLQPSAYDLADKNEIEMFLLLATGIQ